MASTDQPWDPATATGHIREIADDPESDVTWTRHALERLEKRGLLTSDALWVLRSGFVREPTEEESTVKGLFKYAIEGLTPNSDRRTVRVVVVPDRRESHIKVLTVMWKDNS